MAFELITTNMGSNDEGASSKEEIFEIRRRMAV